MSDPKEAIYKALLDRIESGVYPPGSKMPTEREMAKEFGVTNWSIHLTLNELEENGFIKRTRALGTFVCENIAISQVRRQRNSRSKTVAIIVSRNFSYTRHGYGDIIGDTERCLADRDFNVVYDDMPGNCGDLTRYLDNCVSSGVKALVIFPEREELGLLRQHRDLIVTYPVDIFFFNRGFAPNDVLPFNCVSVDMFQSGVEAAAWIIRKDFDNIAFLATDHFEYYWLDTRYRGFKEELELHGKAHRLIVGKGVENMLGPALSYVQDAKTPAVLVASSDGIAVPVYDNLVANKHLPYKDFHMMSFDDLPM